MLQRWIPLPMQGKHRQLPRRIYPNATCAGVSTSCWKNMRLVSLALRAIKILVVLGHLQNASGLVQAEANLAVWVSVPDALSKYVLPKGYVSLNGCSLTVGESVKGGQFSIHLIPETRSLTIFGQVRSGDQLNLEIDSQTQAIVDTVERVLDQRL